MKKILSKAETGESMAEVVEDDYGLTLNFRKNADANIVAFSASEDTLRAIGKAINQYVIIARKRDNGAAYS